CSGPSALSFGTKDNPSGPVALSADALTNCQQKRLNALGIAVLARSLENRTYGIHNLRLARIVPSYLFYSLWRHKYETALDHWSNRRRNIVCGFGLDWQQDLSGNAAGPRPRDHSGRG